YRSGNPSQSEVLDSATSLRERGVLTPASTLDLTLEYQQKAEAAEARLELSREQFRGSLRKRARERNGGLDEAARERAVEAVAAFLDELCRERGLGVAQNLATSDAGQASRRAVSLVQHLPDHLGTCRSRDEALAAIHLTADILTRPTEAETIFLGLLCQAY